MVEHSQQKQPIFGGLGPQITMDDLRTSCAFLCMPWQWKKLRIGEAVTRLERELGSYLGVSDVWTFDSGRSALCAGIAALGLRPGEEVLVQAYTCIVVVNAIRAAGGTPVYVDVDDSLTMSVDDIERHVTVRTRVIIVQHTFGVIAPVDAIQTIAKKHGLIVIEDCAHALGGMYRGRQVGSFGDMSMFSFGSEKVLSSGRGGALCIRDSRYREQVDAYHRTVSLFPRRGIFQQLITFFILFFGKKIYTRGGKILLWIANRLHLISKIITPEEKQGAVPSWMPRRFPQVFAVMILKKFAHLRRINSHRAHVAALYDRHLAPDIRRQTRPFGGIYLEYIIFVDNPGVVIRELKKHRIYLTAAWSGTNIVPLGVDRGSTGYVDGSCPSAEQLSRLIVQLPTHGGIDNGTAARIAQYINRYANRTYSR